MGPMAESPKPTPMMQQYFEVKRGLPRDTLLLFRLGDFYELFFDDALVASRLLGLTLTKRQEHPMAGLPHHAAETYIGKLLAAGKKVAICDQDEPAQQGRLVRRKLTRILSPGTTLSASQLEAARNRYLCALSLDKRGLHAAWIELSTGEFKVATAPRIGDLLPVLASLDPAELIAAEGDVERWKAAPHDQAAVHALHAFAAGRALTELPAYRFETAAGARAVAEAIGVLNLQGFGLEGDHPALGPAGALVGYATDNLCARPENLRGLQEYRSARTLLLDPATLRNLEIFSPIRGGRQGSLLATMDRTATSAGSRLLERWLAAPGLDLPEVRRRHALVGEFVAQPARLAELSECLRGVRESGTSRASSGGCRTASATPASCAECATRSRGCRRSGECSAPSGPTPTPCAAAPTSSRSCAPSSRPPSPTSRRLTSPRATSSGRATMRSSTGSGRS